MSDILDTINQKGSKATFNLLQWATELPTGSYTLTFIQWQNFTNHPSVRWDLVVVADKNSGATQENYPIQISVFDREFESVNWENSVIKFKNGTIFELENNNE